MMLLIVLQEEINSYYYYQHESKFRATERNTARNGECFIGVYFSCV